MDTRYADYGRICHRKRGEKREKNLIAKVQAKNYISDFNYSIQNLDLLIYFDALI